MSTRPIGKAATGNTTRNRGSRFPHFPEIDSERATAARAYIGDPARRDAQDSYPPRTDTAGQGHAAALRTHAVLRHERAVFRRSPAACRPRRAVAGRFHFGAPPHHALVSRSRIDAVLRRAAARLGRGDFSFPVPAQTTRRLPGGSPLPAKQPRSVQRPGGAAGPISAIAPTREWVSLRPARLREIDANRQPARAPSGNAASDPSRDIYGRWPPRPPECRDCIFASAQALPAESSPSVRASAYLPLRQTAGAE